MLSIYIKELYDRECEQIWPSIFVIIVFSYVYICINMNKHTKLFNSISNEIHDCDINRRSTSYVWFRAFGRLIKLSILIFQAIASSNWFELLYHQFNCAIIWISASQRIQHYLHLYVLDTTVYLYYISPLCAIPSLDDTGNWS